jgi:nicotinamide-nucleotide adenylyltransferase
VDRLGRVGIVARWKPVHRGHAAVLRGLCDCADAAIVGIGSSNRYDARNPFTVDETAEMIRRVLAARTNYQIVTVADLNDGPRWRAQIVALFGPLEAFVSDNDYVARLLAPEYPIRRPIAFVAEGERVPIDGTMVRRALARGEGWRELVPPEVAAYIDARGLDRRFRAEFGLATLAQELDSEGEHVLVG